MICGIKNEDILQEIDNEKIFQAICKIKNVDYYSITENLIRRIQNSDISDKDIYISEKEIWDEEYISIIKEENILYISDELLYNKEKAINFFKDDIKDESELKKLWIETTEEEKEMIQLAKECKIDSISIEIM